eukprot:CAMPEP_0198152774 /NCGR_PEP_ID=MMETSP1443-20131203/61295_1 /TAXON_ID=186043 /ORGANISM="Entomoneis sp., Strain CCMP2396" /LENGTH=41 /DNA_ID= /DNA_START= /DNA_END= /DNA_ORIENTATION=
MMVADAETVVEFGEAFYSQAETSDEVSDNLEMGELEEKEIA